MGRLTVFIFSLVSMLCTAQYENNSVRIKGGTTIIGNPEQPDAQPSFSVKVSDFRMQQHEVTNAEFAVFVKQTGYVTLAERKGGSYVFYENVSEDSSTLQGAPWWKFQTGISWKRPRGIHSTIDGFERHPVVHIAYEDACAYCEWLGMRLPTEVEREYAARKNGEEPSKNTWQGTFPVHDSAEDGYKGTAPVGSFGAGKAGLYDMQGNVWEWCLDPYHQNAYYFAEKWPVSSSEPLVPFYFDEHSPMEETRVIRGGSYLCTDQYCKGYEAGMRMRSSVKMTFSHIGFRCVKGK